MKEKKKKSVYGWTLTGALIASILIVLLLPGSWPAYWAKLLLALRMIQKIGVFIYEAWPALQVYFWGEGGRGPTRLFHIAETMDDYKREAPAWIRW